VIAFECGCGEPLAAAPEHAGRKVKCPRCGEVQAVPEPEPAAAPPPPRRRAASPPPRARRRKDEDDEDEDDEDEDEDGEPDDPVERMMAKAHADLDAEEARRKREWRPVVFTPGLVGGLAVFVVFSLLAVVFLLVLLLYPAIGCLCVAFMGLARAVLSFLGRGVD
jgi:uncharacterized Zn finger protein (UPF0148 family)